MPGELDGLVAVVTGGGSGIGAAVVAVFAAEGARVAVVDRDRGRAAAVAERVRAQGGSADAFECDVRDSADVARRFDEIAQQMHAIDALVCAAGVREIAHALTLSPEVWDDTVATDLSGTFYCCQAAARRMSTAGGGTLTAIASISGLIGEADRAAYCAAKHGVLGLTKALACDFARYGIRVNAICPGLVRTPLTEDYFADDSFTAGLADTIPLGKAGEPHDIAEAALFLASRRAQYITGVALPIDGGFLAEKAFVQRAGTAYAAPRVA
jgi:NAD(P)-dependent dehydrogenase (short-subunit alcohol dehydrogenase family)